MTRKKFKKNKRNRKHNKSQIDAKSLSADIAQAAVSPSDVTSITSSANFVNEENRPKRDLFDWVQLFANVATVIVLLVTVCTIRLNIQSTELLQKQIRLELYSKLGDITPDSLWTDNDHLYYTLTNGSQISLWVDTSTFIQVVYTSETQFDLGIKGSMSYQLWLLPPKDTSYHAFYATEFLSDYRKVRPQFTLAYHSIDKSSIGDDYNIDVIEAYHMNYEKNKVIFERLNVADKVYLLAAMMNEIEKGLVEITPVEHRLLNRFFAKLRFDKVQQVPKIQNIKNILLRHNDSVRVKNYVKQPY